MKYSKIKKILEWSLILCVVWGGQWLWSAVGDPVLVPGSTEITTLGTIATGTWQATDVEVPYGGTGASTLTDGGVLIGAGISAVSPMAVLTNGQLLIGNTGAQPEAATLTATANETTVTEGSGSITIGIVDPLIVGKGGTGAITLTDGGIVLGSGTAVVTILGQATNGQLPIGATGGDPVLAVLQDTTSGVSITNKAGEISIGLDDYISLSGVTVSNAYWLGDEGWIGIENGLERIVFDTAGYVAVMGASLGVGIATPDPDFKMTLKSSAVGKDWILGQQSDGGQGFRIGTDANDDAFLGLNKADATQTLYLFSNGDSYFNGGGLGIMTPTPDTTLQVVGTFKSGDDNTNYASFASDGELTLTGTARVWRSDNLEPVVVKLPAANAPANDTIDGFPFHRYDSAVTESVYYHWEIPDSYGEGTANVRGHYDFVVESVVAGTTEYVVLGYEWKKISAGDVVSFTVSDGLSVITETIGIGETPWIKHETDLGTLPTTGWVHGDTILFRFFRAAGWPTDTYDNAGPANNDAWLFNYHLEYMSDRLGDAS